MIEPPITRTGKLKNHHGLRTRTPPGGDSKQTPKEGGISYTGFSLTIVGGERGESADGDLNRERTWRTFRGCAGSED